MACVTPPYLEPEDTNPWVFDLNKQKIRVDLGWDEKGYGQNKFVHEDQDFSLGYIECETSTTQTSGKIEEGN